MINDNYLFRGPSCPTVKQSCYYRRYFRIADSIGDTFFSIDIGIADTFVAMYPFEYRRYFIALSNFDTFTDTFSLEFA
jgi:hypothetical protein